MPDLVTHVASAYFVVRSPRFRRYRIFFYLGTILPDLLSRPIHIMRPQWYAFSIAVHTPLFMLVSCLLLAELFPSFRRRTVFGYTFSGTLLHFLLDMLQRHLGDGYYWLFPFSWQSFELGLFWPESSSALIPIWMAAISMIEWGLYRRRKSS